MSDEHDDSLKRQLYGALKENGNCTISGITLRLCNHKEAQGCTYACLSVEGVSNDHCVVTFGEAHISLFPRGLRVFWEELSPSGIMEARNAIREWKGSSRVRLTFRNDKDATEKGRLVLDITDPGEELTELVSVVRRKLLKPDCSLVEPPAVGHSGLHITVTSVNRVRDRMDARRAPSDRTDLTPESPRLASRPRNPWQQTPNARELSPGRPCDARRRGFGGPQCEHIPWNRVWQGGNYVFWNSETFEVRLLLDDTVRYQESF